MGGKARHAVGESNSCRTGRCCLGTRGGVRVQAAGLPALPLLFFPFYFFPFLLLSSFFDFPFFLTFLFLTFQRHQAGGAGRTTWGATAARGTSRTVGGHVVVFLRGKKMAVAEARVIRKKKQGLHKVPAIIERVSTQIQQRHLLNESARLKRLLGRGTNLK